MNLEPLFYELDVVDCCQDFDFQIDTPRPISIYGYVTYQEDVYHEPRPDWGNERIVESNTFVDVSGVCWADDLSDLHPLTEKAVIWYIQKQLNDRYK